MGDAGRGRLREIVRAALGEPGATLGEWEVTPLLGGMGASDPARALVLVRGDARVGAEERAWKVVLKGFAPVAGRDDPAGFAYWKREWSLYDSGLLDALPAGFRAPRCYGRDESADGVVWLWLEYVQEEGERWWSHGRWARAARGLGRFNGAYATDRALPRAPWLGGGRLRAWVARHEPLVARIAAAPDNPEVRAWWPRPTVDAILRLWEERTLFCDAIERLPQTFAHGDAIRRNLLARRGADGEEEIVGIDWEFAGHYAIGEEVGQTLSVASAFYDVEPDELPALDGALFAGYLDGLRDAGWRGDERGVRFAYAAHAALRNAFNAVGATVPDEAGRALALQNYGHTWEELAERRAAIRPFLLARAEEARGLLASIWPAHVARQYAVSQRGGERLSGGGTARADFADQATRADARQRARATIERLVRDGTAVARSDGTVHRLFPVGISPAEGEALRGWVAREGAARTIEVGLGYGISALYICAGLLDSPDPAPRHVALDPSQATRFADCGLQALDEAGVGALVEHHATLSELALPRFVGEGRSFDLAFVDGNHRFDGVFLDLIYLGRLVRPGGIIFLDDYQLPAIRRAASFCLTNLGWTLEEVAVADERHHWAVLRTATAPDTRRYDDYVEF